MDYGNDAREAGALRHGLRDATNMLSQGSQRVTYEKKLNLPEWNAKMTLRTSRAGVTAPTAGGALPAVAATAVAPMHAMAAPAAASASTATDFKDAPAVSTVSLADGSGWTAWGRVEAGMEWLCSCSIEACGQSV